MLIYANTRTQGETEFRPRESQIDECLFFSVFCIHLRKGLKVCEIKKIKSTLNHWNTKRWTKMTIFGQGQNRTGKEPLCKRYFVHFQIPFTLTSFSNIEGDILNVLH